MQIVIEIDEEDYKIMKHNIAVNNPLCPLSQEEMVSKVANGTPLPKGHGRLIDEIIKALEQEPCGKDINVRAEDCISRQAAIDALGECPMNWTDSDAEMTAERDWKDTVEMLNSLPSVIPQPKSEKWIPVSERLPEKENWYLVCFDDGERDLVCFDIGGFSYSRIIAWMPLPEPYKSDKGE